MQIAVPELDVQRANLPTISVGHLAVGPIAVDELVLSNTNLSMSTGQAVLRNVNVDLSLTIAVEWSVNATIDLGFLGTYGFSDGGTINVGTIGFSLPVPIPELIITSLKSIQLNIPTLTARNVSVAASPLTNLALTNARADQVRASTVKLPTAGFTLSGLSLTSVQGNAISVPAGYVDQASVGHVTGDAIRVIELSTGHAEAAGHWYSDNKQHRSVRCANHAWQTTIPVADALGVLTLTLDLTPTVTSHIQSLVITGADANATADTVTVRNISLPYDALNLTLSQLGLDTIQVPQFSII